MPRWNPMVIRQNMPLRLRYPRVEYDGLPPVPTNYRHWSAEIGWMLRVQLVYRSRQMLRFLVLGYLDLLSSSRRLIFSGKFNFALEPRNLKAASTYALLASSTVSNVLNHTRATMFGSRISAVHFPNGICRTPL